MPLITVEAGALNKEQKKQLAQEITATAAKIMKVPEQAIIMLMKENDLDNFSTAGKLVSEIMSEQK